MRNIVQEVKKESLFKFVSAVTGCGKLTHAEQSKVPRVVNGGEPEVNGKRNWSTG